MGWEVLPTLTTDYTTYTGILSIKQWTGSIPGELCAAE